MTSRPIEVVVEALKQQCAVPILRTLSAENALGAARAVAKAGFKLIDIPVTVPGAIEAIGELAKNDDLIVGAGSVVSMADATSAIAAGAKFIISPFVNVPLIDYCNDNDIFIAVGGMSSTEIMEAHLAGADMVLVYPVHLIGGPKYIEQMIRPMPFLNLMAIGGVTPESIPEYLDAGASAVGMTENLIDPQLCGRGDFESIYNRAVVYFAAIQKANKGH
jgi:2-dehydro-3-deoxyphosphogluconate aldolase/(4S)-4-hydroxy-2-oxoglutarate aldolase